MKNNIPLREARFDGMRNRLGVWIVHENYSCGLYPDPARENFSSRPSKDNPLVEVSVVDVRHRSLSVRPSDLPLLKGRT